MSFFAGAFATRSASDIPIHHPETRVAFRLNAGASIWRSPGQAILAHIQAIVTPEDRSERLPMLFDAGGKALVFDGRLDNRAELTRSLSIRESGAEIPDSAFVAAAIERWGDDACSHLLGDFAFACWDIKRRRLVLACDPAGGRTIFYHVNSDRILFATTVAAILGFPGVQRNVDLQSVARAMLDSAPENGRTMFVDVRQITPAGRILWSAERMVIDRYWSPDFTKRIRYSHDEDYVAAARELLDAAVSCRLRAIDPVVCHLSGGFDSSAVTATAARLTAPRSLSAVTAVPQPGVPLRPNTSRIFVDETEHAAAVARMHPNLVWRPMAADPPAYNDPRSLFHARGSPTRNFLNVWWFGAADRKVRELGSKVLLTGRSGNLTLSWHGPHRMADLARKGKVVSLLREFFCRSRTAGEAWRAIKSEILPPLLSSEFRASLRRSRGHAEKWKTQCALNANLAATVGAERITAETQGTDRLDLDSSLRLSLLERMWRCNPDPTLRSFYGFERRDPLGDIRLVEFCIALPPEQFLMGGVSRRLARRVLADRLPQQIIEENRRGRQIPDWFYRLNCARGELASTLERLRKSPLASYVLDLPRMQAALDNWPADAAAAQGLYMPLACILSRGLNMGVFLEWVEGGCVPPETGLHSVNEDEPWVVGAKTS